MNTKTQQSPGARPAAKGREASRGNPLLDLQRFGQSVWLDYMRRDLITSGELQRLVTEDGLRGLTSNPTIFEKALTGSSDYDDVLRAATTRGERDANAIYEEFAVADIQQAADVLRPEYDRTQQKDGFVCLEVAPRLAHDTQGTLAEARRLWKKVGRENLMVKVPGTPEGVPAIRQLISEGINVNVTLLFARDAYARVAEAYLAGLEAYAGRGGALRGMSSVASFFVSRIDTEADARIEARLEAGVDDATRDRLNGLLGKTAIANARLAYQMFKDMCQSRRWQALARQGANVQRLLWASTSTKNPQYRDVVYVEELIGPDTVDTMPPATIDAFRDHGRARLSIEDHLEDARKVEDALRQSGIALRDITDKLLDDGVRSFADSFDKLMAAIGSRVGREGGPSA